MKSKLIFTLFIVFVGLSACSKDKRIERRLEKKDGKWNIKSMSYQYFNNNSLEDSFMFTNAGSFVFDDNGSVIYNYDYDGDSGSQSGTWSNTEDEVIMILDGEVLTMKIEEESRKEMTLNWTEEYSATNEKETYIFKLERAN